MLSFVYKENKKKPEIKIINSIEKCHTTQSNWFFNIYKENNQNIIF